MLPATSHTIPPPIGEQNNAAMEELITPFKQLLDTNMTRTVHRDSYPAISTTRPELDQSGRTVLITGGGTGVGLAIARSFVRAHAETVIIIGRRIEVLANASSILEQLADEVGTSTRIITRKCDISKLGEVEAFWNDLRDQSITIDVYVANAAKFNDPVPLFELGVDEVWSELKANLKSPLYFAEKFNAQPCKRQKVSHTHLSSSSPLYTAPDSSNRLQFILNVTSQAISMLEHPWIPSRPSYVLSKMTSTLIFQVIAQNIPPQEVQIINFHPGAIYNAAWEATGLPRDVFDNGETSVL